MAQGDFSHVVKSKPVPLTLAIFQTSPVPVLIYGQASTIPENNDLFN
jgi:hypothetical protein